MDAIVNPCANLKEAEGVFFYLVLFNPLFFPQAEAQVSLS